MALASGGNPGFDLDVAAAGNSNVVRAKLRTVQEIDIDTEIEDIMITLSNQYHLIRALNSRDAAGGRLTGRTQAEVAARRPEPEGSDAPMAADMRVSSVASEFSCWKTRRPSRITRMGWHHWTSSDISEDTSSTAVPRLVSAVSISLGLDGLAGTLRRGEAALEHRVDDVAGAGFARRVPAHDPAVAHHQDPVHERADLVHPVGHVEDAAAALGRHLAQDVGQGLLRAQEAAHRHIQVEADACLLEHSQPMRQQAAFGDALTGTDELADAHARRRLEALLHGA